MSFVTDHLSGRESPVKAQLAADMELENQHEDILRSMKSATHQLRARAIAQSVLEDEPGSPSCVLPCLVSAGAPVKRKRAPRAPKPVPADMKHEDILRLLDVLDKMDEILAMHHAIVQAVSELKCQCCGTRIELALPVMMSDVDLSC